MEVFGETETSQKEMKAEPEELNRMVEFKKGIATTLNLQNMQQAIKDDLTAAFKSSQLEIRCVLEEIQKAWKEIEMRLNTQADLVTLMKDVSHNLTNIKQFQTTVKSQKMPANLNCVAGVSQDQEFQFFSEKYGETDMWGHKIWNEESLALVEGKDKPKRPKTSCAQTRKPVEVQPPGEKQQQQLIESKRKCEDQSGIIQRLKSCLRSSNQKIEVFALVIQHLQSKREEALKQCKELSLEIQNYRGELVTTSVACGKLEEERNELQTTYERYVQKLNQQHQSDLVELEEKLKQFYTGECEKLQNICIEEAEKYKSQLQEQVDNLNITHENFKLELETSHLEKINDLKKEYESSFSELKNTYTSERKTLEDSFREKQEELEKKINELQGEVDCLNEKLKLEEQKWAAKEKANLKNPQLMYLEQELESLKAVLEIKNEQLRQQDSKLLKMENLVENNNTMMEKMRKVQQENEELKARMDKHMELSRQLSTEQQALQESLEKESKVNKRLSMENEELLWKLHNGDLCSPKKLSPGTPPMPFPSRRNSSSFSSPTVSPR